MTNQEYDILDELYFLTSFSNLQENCGVKPPELKQNLWLLIMQGWVLWHQNGDEEFIPTKSEFETEFGNYHYLASKIGLLAHNAR